MRPAPAHVHQDRLWSSLTELAGFGRFHDSASDLYGVSRPALTPPDVEARQWLLRQMTDVGLDVWTDAVGNLFGRYDGTDPGIPPLMIGSHVDSVPQGGMFDGALGVLAAMEVIRALREAGHSLRRSVVVAVFTEEEGSRFGTDMLGSAVAAGRIPLEQALALRDADGVTLGEALEKTGFAGHGSVLAPPYAYLEVHIEQGPILSSAGVDIGLPTGVQAISWHELTVTGKAAHAGATPAHLRVDAAKTATRLMAALFEYAAARQDGGLMMTVGRMRLEPGVTNIVPRLASFTVDLRAPDDGLVTDAEAHLSGLVEREGQDGPAAALRRLARTQPVPFSEPLRRLVADVAGTLGYSRRSLISGAGHDAQEMAALCPSAMIFVPGLYDGISHTPREYSDPAACHKATNLLAHVVTALCGDDDRSALA
ncbi:Zn-dependent hydrolase [Actinomadura sp. ATCC 39365]|uniref:Zn-dependent hydrolase n=1 Tax=Nonomuraea sp. NPDC005692 TaxID=3157168 RepID=UPI0033E9F4A6